MENFAGQNGGMQMKKLGLVLLTIIMLSLTGCIHEYQLSAEETDVAAEYMAGVLLENDRNYQKDLLDWEELKEADSKEDTKAEDSKEEGSEKEGSSSKPVKTDEKDKEAALPKEDLTISDVIGAKDFDITYQSYKLCSVYPEDETNAYFSLTPREGNQLFVASFMVENKSKKDKRLDLRKAKVEYQLDINVGMVYKPLLPLLENSLRYLNMEIGAGKKEEVILIFEIPKDIVMEDINLIISDGAKTEIIDIK
jgi:hypothetical protein